MKVYLAGEREAISKASGERSRWSHVVKRRLFSYFYHGFENGNRVSRDVQELSTLGLDLFLDSGAFTAFTKKAVIDVKYYAEFIHNTSALWTVRSSLDAIGDPAKSYDYFQELRALGCKVQPVFHCREDEKWLVKYLEEGHDYVFLGGMVPETTGFLTDWLNRLWSLYLTNKDGTPRVKVHGFGLTDQKLMFSYPWHSVDSTSWLMIGVFGGCALMMVDGMGRPVLRKVVFSDSSPLLKEKDSWHYQRRTPIEQRAIDAALVRFGTTAQECATHYSYRDMVNAATYQEMESAGTDTFIDRQQYIA